ncbi:MAG TPA: cytochrome c [Desulfuromonadales bacterium]|nr:cytochrome c [Desulfuromonadales bacterium]
MKHRCILAIICSLAVVSILQPRPALAVVEGGDSEHGRQLGIELCLPCHVQGAEAGTMRPISKTQRQWERFFQKDRHAKIAPGTWEGITEQQLKDILQFLYDHAADSDEPAVWER